MAERELDTASDSPDATEEAGLAQVAPDIFERRMEPHIAEFMAKCESEGVKLMALVLVNPDGTSEPMFAELGGVFDVAKLCAWIAKATKARVFEQLT